MSMMFACTQKNHLVFETHMETFCVYTSREFGFAQAEKRREKKKEGKRREEKRNFWVYNLENCYNLNYL